MSATPAAQPAPEPILLRRDADGVATLTLNRPAARNALSSALMTAMQDQLDRLAGDASVRVVVIAGNGPAFCAGHDLKEIRANPGRQHYEALFAQCSRMMESIVRLPKPVIAKVAGVATAAGCQLVASCDMAIAAEGARFAVNGIDQGLFCSTPMVALSRNVGRKQAMEMLTTGRLIGADEAVRVGLVNRAVPAARLDDEVAALARVLAEKLPAALALGKAAFYRQLEMPLDEAYRYTSGVITCNLLDPDVEEGIDAFLEKREPAWRRK